MKRRSRNRRGVILVISAVIMVVVMTFLAVVYDMSRMYAQKNDLQNAADAAALAGVVELIDDTTRVIDSAVAIGQANEVFRTAARVARADVICGRWDGRTSTYLGDSQYCGKVDNAVTVTVRDSANYLFAALLNARKEIAVTARAYAAFVGRTRCVKPWAFAYATLTLKLDPSNPDTLRNLTDYDIQQMNSLGPANLTFQLKSDSPPNAAGNFGSLDVPNDDPDAANGGGNLYRYNISHCNNLYLGPGDTTNTLTGNMVGPTKQGAEDLCQPLAANGDCYNEDGTVGVKAKVALWSQMTARANGTYQVIIRQIVAVKIMNVSNKAVVTGYFLPLNTTGAVTSTQTTIRRPILVQ